MFERFTDRSRRVLVLAQEEARDLSHPFIGTQHILLGLIRERDGLAAKTLDATDVTYDAVREKVMGIANFAADAAPGSPPFTPRAKKILEFALREAMQLGHNYIGTEHMLLGLLREGSGVAMQILRDLGVEAIQVRDTILKMMAVQSVREFDGSSTRESFGSAMFRRAVRTVGEELRTDLDAVALDDRAMQIANDLYAQLRDRWLEPESPR